VTDRGRVPFALVGVLLLVSSATLAASVQAPAASGPAVDRVLDRTTAETNTALRSAVRTAADRAARNPVVRPADTPVGRLLSPERPFRDALELRIYGRAQTNLASLERERHGIVVSASLPTAEDPRSLRRALERITVRRAGDSGTKLRVHVENVTLTARRGGVVVGRRTVDANLTVRSPVLAVHDRARLFEQRLNAGPGSRGLGRRLAARLYPVVWTRGYVQYEGGPIENVLANRHVGLFANGAILDTQRTVFGASDPLGRRVLHRATAEVAIGDVVQASGSHDLQLLQELRKEAGVDVTARSSLGDLEPNGSLASPDDTMTVGVNRTADWAFLGVQQRLSAVLDRTYSAKVRLQSDVRRLDHTRQADEAEPGWQLLDSTTETETSVSPRSPDAVRPSDGYHVLERYGRTVERITTRTRTWRTPSGNATTRTITRSTFAVTLVLECDHTRGPAPERPVERAHRPGGPFDGPNLDGARERAVDRLVRDAGGADSLARAAVTDGVETTSTVIQGDWPADLRRWAYRDLVERRERVRDVSFTTTRGKIGSFQVNPPARLRERLADRRAQLLDAPDRYSDLARRARVGVRAAYVEAVDDRLRLRALAQRTGKSHLDEAMNDAGGDAARLLARSHAGRNRDVPTGEGISGLPMRVDATPSYLPIGAVDSSVVPAVDGKEYPMVVKSRNTFGVPFGGGGENLFGFLSKPKRTNLRAAAQLLAVTQTDNGPAVIPAQKLERQVTASLVYLRLESLRVLATQDLGDEAARAEVVERALDRWDSKSARALAYVNGSAAAAIHEAAVERWPERLDGTRQGDLQAVRLDLAIQRALDRKATRPTQSAVSGVANRARSDGVARQIALETTQLASDAASDLALKRARARVKAKLPAGLPVVPAPSFWFATVNVWHVQVRGEYPRFVVRGPRGSPDSSDAALTYVRENASVAFDVDGDGEPERLGRSTRIRFETEVAIGIAVPPGPQGVGDAGGDRIEWSPGWPIPGPASEGFRWPDSLP